MPTNDQETPKGSKPESAATRKGPGASKYGPRDQFASKDEEEDEKPWWLILFGGQKKEEEKRENKSQTSSHRRNMRRAGLIAGMKRRSQYKKAMAKRKASLDARRARDIAAGKKPARVVTKPKAGTLASGKPTMKGVVKQAAHRQLGVNRGPLTGAALAKRAGLWGGLYVGARALIGAVEGFAVGKLAPALLTGKTGSNAEALAQGVKSAGGGAWEGAKDLIPGRQAYNLAKEGKWGAAFKSLGKEVLTIAGVGVAAAATTAGIVALGIASVPVAAAAVGVALVAVPVGMAIYDSPVLSGAGRLAMTAEGREAMSTVAAASFKDNMTPAEMAKLQQATIKVATGVLAPDMKEQTKLASDESDHGGEEGKKGGGKSRGGKSKNEPLNQRPERMAQAVVASNPTMGGSYSRLSMKEEDPATVSDTTPRHGDLSLLKNATASQLNDGPAANPVTTQHAAKMGMMANGVNSAGQAGQMPSNLEPYRLDHASIKLDHANNNIAMGAKLDQRDAYEAQKKWQQSAAAAQKHSLGAAMMFKPGGEG